MLQGDDEADVGARFDQRTREWLVVHQGRVVRIEAYRDTLAFFTQRAHPDQLEPILAEAREFLALWR